MKTKIYLSTAFIFVCFVALGFAQQNNKPIAPSSISNLISDGSRTSLYKVGVAYETGNGVKKNLSTALKWYYEASVKGSVDAHYAIWSLWEEVSMSNIDCPFPSSQFDKSRKLAIEGYEHIAHNAKNPELFYRLGLLYDPGIGMDEPGVQISEKYLTKAAKMGHKEAKDLLKFKRDFESGHK
ncbi:MAG: tetratricopeptide repeat protein [Smithella sp.]